MCGVLHGFTVASRTPLHNLLGWHTEVKGTRGSSATERAVSLWTLAQARLGLSRTCTVCSIAATKTGAGTLHRRRQRPAQKRSVRLRWEGGLDISFFSLPTLFVLLFVDRAVASGYPCAGVSGTGGACVGDLGRLASSIYVRSCRPSLAAFALDRFVGTCDTCHAPASDPSAPRCVCLFLLFCFFVLFSKLTPERGPVYIHSYHWYLQK